MRHPTLTLFVLTTLTAHAFAQNDDCSGAIAVNQGPNGPFSNVGATTSSPTWPCGAGGNDLWFLYVAPSTGSLTADTCGSGFDTVLEIFDGTGGCGSLVSLGCNDDYCSVQSSVTTSMTVGNLYYIRVGGYSGATGTFTLDINTVPATSTAVGRGCIGSYASFYENFATASAFDLAGSTMMLVRTLPGYIAIAAGAYVPPTAAATTLALFDDSEVTQALTTPFPYDGGVAASLTVCSNGYVSVASGNGTGYGPSITSMLNATQTGWWVWHDFNPTITGGGVVKFEQVGSVAYITWDGVWDYGGATTANASTFQMQFDSGTGSVTYAWQTMSPLGGTTATGFLVGYSPGGTSLDPGTTDISVALASSGITVPGVDVQPLTLGATSRPVLGSSWSLTTSAIPATGVFGVEILGLTNPGIPDLFFLGMPSCGLYASLDYMNVFLVGGPTHSWSLPVPANQSLIGVHVFASSALFQSPPVNAFGAITSNGLDGLVGDV